ncbi:hypothetical protein SAMN02927903_02099 [Flavobacterium caeni]|uniref:Uncharacterized protein n=1 Tax=Flavobacterium caeni TaxID=490189 RepID=A0A1G5I559_9FLAO|nr:hypothetical protein SAMN02927903_02099 [Flavobacterium caeni]
MITGKNKKILPQFTTIYHFVDKFYHFLPKSKSSGFTGRFQTFNKLLRI